MFSYPLRTYLTILTSCCARCLFVVRLWLRIDQVRRESWQWCAYGCGDHSIQASLSQFSTSSIRFTDMTRSEQPNIRRYGVLEMLTTASYQHASLIRMAPTALHAYQI
ncbi:hypothetical protein PLICRDRAFT_488842 [Plicaturopsis crispa FD-325 SS-3]|nr:hypothetical protein PLICRDRAFT_488842 [Plicaturopsis crispa FD-325 SS-3]